LLANQREDLGEVVAFPALPVAIEKGKNGKSWLHLKSGEHCLMLLQRQETMLLN